MLHPMNEAGTSRRIYLRISKGAIISKRNGETTTYRAISGSLKGIELKEHEFDNKKFRSWHIILEDTSSGEEYDIAVSRESGAFKSIARSLVTEQGLGNLDRRADASAQDRAGGRQGGPGRLRPDELDPDPRQPHQHPSRRRLADNRDRRGRPAGRLQLKVRTYQPRTGHSCAGLIGVC